MIDKLFVAAVVAGSASTAWASETVRYEPAPAWVKPAPAVDAAKLDGDSPLLLVADDQQRLVDGEVWSYQERATRVASPDVLAKVGTVSIAWQPSKGDLVVHKLEIIRGAEHIDALSGGRKFTIIRREQQLEQLAIDGQLTATVPVEGLRVGDVLRFVVSTTNREPALGGELQAVTLLPVAPAKVGFSRARFLWPATKPVSWRGYAAGLTDTIVTAGDFKELTIAGPLPKPADLPDDVPVRFRSLPIVEATTFADWPAVSRVMAPLYATKDLIAPGSDLAKEVATIAAATTDPTRRTAAALELVQEKVRYLYNGMENGNYQPQAPAKTWALRYGDCKAKTLLLLAVLHALQIEAEPILASSQLGDYVPKRLPTAAAFDHVLVHATIGSASYWLDGTGTGARFANLNDTPPFGWVLPVRAGGAAPIALPMHAPTLPMVVTTIELDQRAGLGMPTLVHANAVVHGPAAEMIGLAKSQGSKEQQEQMVGGMIAGSIGRDMVMLTDFKITYDPAAAQATIDANAITGGVWYRTDRRYRLDLDRTVTNIGFSPDRARSAWQALPVSLGMPQTTRLTTRVLLPAGITGFAFEGDQTIAQPLAGAKIARTTTIGKDVITIDDRVGSDGGEILPADVPAMRSRVAAAKNRLLRVIAPADVPSRWDNVVAGRSDGRFKPIAAAYAAAIARDPDEASAYVNRANYLAGIFDWKGALPDLDKAVSLDPTADTLVTRADAYRTLGDEAKATTDYQAALKVDPTLNSALVALGRFDLDHGRRDAALARVDDQLASAGEGKYDLLSAKADLLEYAGDKDAALAVMDEAVAAKPSNANLLNGRCWLKAKLRVGLDTALKDCTKSIELAEQPAAPLDSRALVYFRLGRFDDAMADVDAALDIAPNQSDTLWLRGVLRSRKGDAVAARADFAAARLMNPLVEKEYKRLGVMP